MFVEVAMQHNDSYTENIYTFVNNVNTPEGGTHLAGLKNALTKTINKRRGYPRGLDCDCQHQNRGAAV